VYQVPAVDEAVRGHTLSGLVKPARLGLAGAGLPCRVVCLAAVQEQGKAMVRG
jgi:hypothetical protein